ncbi:MAG TPA: hypothetical protein VFZ23_00350 [Pyrinomonadaceae bacterium]
MERIKNYLLGSMVFIIATLVLALANNDVRRVIAEEFKDVRVINSVSQPALVRDVDSSVRLPVHFNQSYTVPGGKRLVIEYVSLHVAAPSECDLITVALSSETNALHLFNPTFVGTSTVGPSTAYRYAISQETRAYIGQNRTASFSIQSFAGCNPNLSHAGATGYLVDLQ